MSKIPDWKKRFYEYMAAQDLSTMFMTPTRRLLKDLPQLPGSNKKSQPVHIDMDFNQLEQRVTWMIIDDLDEGTEFTQFTEEHWELLRKQGMGQIDRFQFIELPRAEPKVKQGRHPKRPVQKNRGPIKRGEWN